PQALPIFYLRDKTPTSPRWMRQHGDFDGRERRFSVYESLLDKRCLIEKETGYADFPEASEDDPIVLDSARWNNPQRLATYAFRAWLHCCFPYASNTLTTTDGEIWTIDHEKILWRKDEDDIRELADLVAPSERVTNICRQMSAITTREVRAAL